MKSRIVGHRFLTQAKNRVSDWSFRRNVMACYFPKRCHLLKKCVTLIRVENKRTQLCLQIESTEEKSQTLHSQKSPRWAE